MRGISKGIFSSLVSHCTIQTLFSSDFHKILLKIGMDTFQDTKDTKYGRFLGIKKGLTFAVSPCFY